MKNTYYRNVRSANELRQASDPETKPYIRPARRANNLPNSWDDRPRGRTKAWTTRQLHQSRPQYHNSIRYM